MRMIKVILTFILSLGFLIASPVFANSILSPLTDSVNSGIINTKILADNSLSNIHVDATVTNGIAIYSGEVHSKAQVSELIRIARSVSGIRGVNISKLRVLNTSH